MQDDSNRARPKAGGGQDPMPVFDVRTHDRAIAPEISKAIGRVVDSGRFILGPELERFEKALAGWLGGGFVVGVGSGTDALQIALTAAGVGSGDTVLTVPNTAVPTVSAIMAAGARPLFVDVEPGTALIDIRRIEEAIRPNTRVLIPVHLYGRATAMDQIMAIARSRGLVVVEDAAQAHGASWCGRRVGTWGDLGCFSFYPSKNLGAYGDGGAIWTADPEVAEHLRRLRNYGQADRYHHETIGINSRLDEIQAAILTTKLPHLEAWNRKRCELARFLRLRLEALPLDLPEEAEAQSHVYHLFVVRVKQRDRIRRALEQRGIRTQVHYPAPIHLQEAYRYLGYPEGSLPHAEAWCRETLSLPFSPAMSENDFSRVAEALAEVLPASS